MKREQGVIGLGDQSSSKEPAKRENEDLLRLIRAGDRDRLADLWTQVEKLVRWFADRWPTTAAVDREDLYQAGYLAMVDAVEAYDPERGGFTTLLSMHLKTAFADALGQRSAKQRQDPIHQAGSLDRPLDDDGAPGAATLGDLVADPTDAYEDVEDRLWLEQLHAALEDALGQLPTDQAETLRLRYLQGKTQSAVGEATGVDRETVRKREQAGLKTLRCTRLSGPLREFVEDRTPYYAHVGATSFRRSGLSVVELCALKRESLLSTLRPEGERSRRHIGVLQSGGPVEEC